MNISYLISSNIRYGNPLKHLISSMLQGGVEPSCVTAVIGECGLAMSYTQGINFIHVSHNSFDYTALIELVRDPGGFGDYIVLLHDTMEFGPDTDALIKTADPKMWATFAWGGMCNLGLYQKGYLLSQKEGILELENCNKLQAIQAEGFLFKNCPLEHRGFWPGHYLTLGKKRVYGGTERLIEHYTGINLKKYKANFDGWIPRGGFVNDA